MNYTTAPAFPPTAGEVRAELERILDGPEFKTAKRPRQLLKYLVEEALSGRGDNLKAYTIALEVFGRNADFDPQTDPIVRVEGTRLRARLAAYYQANPQNPVRIALPLGGYRPHFHYTPQAVPDTVQPFYWQAAGMHGKPTILILPFAALGEVDTASSHLAHGLTEEIAMGLSRFDDLTIINVPSGLDKQYAEPAWDMADSLGARFILYGNIQIVGNSVRVRVALVDALSRSSLWAEKYDRTYSPGTLFSILDDITAQVVMAVGDSFGFINRFLAREQSGKGVADLKIYEAVLRYHHWISTLDLAQGKEAIDALSRAVDIDPSYALSKAMLADVLAGHYQWGYEQDSSWLERSKTLALAALDLEANSQYVLWAWAFNLYLAGEAGQFLNMARRAIDLNPYNTNIVSVTGVKICMVGHWDEGLALLERCTRLNRGMPGWVHIARVLHFYLLENYGEALATAKTITTKDFWGGPLFRAAIYGQMGDYRAAKAELANLLQTCPRFKKDHTELLQRLFFQEQHVGALLRGLNAAGFKTTGS